MKAQELRIGNWVLHKKVKQPIIINANNLLALYNGADLYEPIPLTSEILVKMGFKKLDDISMSIKMGALTLVCRVNYGHAYFEIPNSLYIGQICSVHQLQNFWYALMSTELQFEL